MPLGAARLTLLAFQPSVTVEAEVIRLKKGITANGNAQVDTAQSKFGGASALFDGTGDALSTAGIAFGTGDFTVEYWLRPTAQSSYDIHWDLRGTPTSNLSPIVYTLNGTLYMDVGATTRITGSALSNNTWYHIALSRSGTSTKLFVNGTQVGSTYTDTNNYVSAATLYIGELYSLAGNGVVGNMDEFRISNTARYTAAFTPPTAPFVNDANTLLLLHMDGTDGSTVFEDDNGVPGGHAVVAVTVSGNTKYSSTVAKYGDTSIYFDGANDKLIVTGDYSQPGDFTAECWFYPTSVSGDRCLFAIGNESTDRQLVLTSGNDLKTDEYGAGGIDISPNNTVTVDAWNHAALTRSGSTVTLWLNGVSQGTSTSSATIGNVNNFYIGALSDDAIDFVGYMDDIRLSRGARYTTTFTPSTTRLVDDANTIFLIQGGGSNDSQAIVDTGSRVKKGITAIGNAQIDTAQSYIGGASALFDGNGDYLQIAQHADLNFGTSNFTVEFWSRITSANTFAAFLSSGTSSYVAGAVVFVGGSGTANNNAMRLASQQQSGNTIVYDQSASAPTNNVWFHWALTRNGNTFTIYRNGTSVGTGTFSGNINFNDNNKTLIGGGNWDGANSYVSGNIDEFRISNICRYTANFTPQTQPFVNDENTLLLLHMDGTDASTYFEDDNGTPGTNWTGRTAKAVTFNGNAQLDTAQYKFGTSSLLLDGSGDYVSSTTLSLGTGDFTIEGWFRSSTSAAGLDFLYDGRPSGSSAVIPTFYFNVGTNVIAYLVSGSIRISATLSWSDDTWYHMALVRSSGTTRIYFNGTQVGSNYSDSNNYVDHNIVIGTSLVDPSLYSWQGHIDEFRISNTARYTTGFTPATQAFVNDANTVLLLHFDGADAATTITDDIGTGRVKVGITAIGTAQIDTAQSKFGGSSLLLDGNSDWLNVYSTDPNIGTGDFTFEWWQRATSGINQYARIVSIRDNDGVTFAISQESSTVYMWLNQGSSGGAQSLGSLGSNTDTWVHFAVVRLSGTVKCYRNGTNISGAGVSNTNTWNYISTRPFNIGAESKDGATATASTYFAGHLEEIRWSNTARYTSNFTPATTPFQNDSNTLLLLHMDGTDAATVFTDDNGVPPDYEY